MIFPETEVYFFKKEFFNLWKNGSDKRFFELIYQAFQKSGLTYYENEKEEMLVRERFVLAFVLYLEYCKIAGFLESEYINYPSAEKLINIKKDFNDDSDDEMIKVINSLSSYFVEIEFLADNLWLNCIEGSENRIIPYNKISKELDLNRNDYFREQGYEFLMSGRELNKYESISF